MSPGPVPTIVIGVPIDCSGRYIGVERMPAALRAAGLVDRLGVPDGGDLDVTIDSAEREPTTGMLGYAAVCRTSRTLLASVDRLLLDGHRPLLIGGCCTLLIGVGAALRRRFGAFGLAFVDGHLDFYDGRTSPTGEAADMELAILSGFGPPGLVDLGGPPPILAPEHGVALGCRDLEQARQDGALDPGVVAPALTVLDARTLRERGPGRVGEQVAARFEAAPGRFWLHLDLDVLDQEVLPAVDYRMPGGLGWEELTELILPLARSATLIGMDVTIYNPSLDPEGLHAGVIVQALGRLLRP